MSETTLEFRGIRLHHIMDYLAEIGGEQVTSSLPYQFEGPYWSAEILKEEEVRITSTFLVNAVHIRFQAPTQEQLDDLLAAFRKKTTRVGG